MIPSIHCVDVLTFLTNLSQDAKIDPGVQKITKVVNDINFVGARLITQQTSSSFGSKIYGLPSSPSSIKPRNCKEIYKQVKPFLMNKAHQEKVALILVFQFENRSFKRGNFVSFQIKVIRAGRFTPLVSIKFPSVSFASKLRFFF